MEEANPDQKNLTGWMLVATPALLDPHFRRTILWLRQHSPAEGALGLVLNRPVGRTLGELAGGACALGVHADSLRGAGGSGGAAAVGTALG